MKTTDLLLTGSFRKSLRVSLSLVLISLAVFVAQAQLAGTYYIGPADSARADYNTFDQAEAALAAGISDSVVFEVLPGSYDVYMAFGNITGTSPNKWVVFRSSTGDPSDVLLSYFYTYTCCGIDNFWIVQLNGAGYIAFENMSFNFSHGNADYCRIIRLEAHAHHINFIGNRFYGKVGTLDTGTGSLIWGENNRNEHIVIEHNEFYNGEYAIYLNGNATPDISEGNIIRYNRFYNQNNRSIYLLDQDAPIISDNYVANNRPGKYGIVLSTVDNAFRITNNIIEMDYGNLGIYLNSCDGLPGLEGLVANNFIDLVGSGFDYVAKGINLYACTNLQIYHNSIALHKNTNSFSACFRQLGGGTNLDVRNNIFYNAAGGFAANITNPDAISNSNNNNYHSNWNYIVRWGSTDLKDFAEFQALRAPFDDASLSVNPVFNSLDPVDLHTSSYFMKDAGADLTAVVPFDIDGELRSSSPCMGADEYTSTTQGPLSGVITVGSNQEFKTISSVVDSINCYGIDGSLTINIMDNGSPYEEQLTIGQVYGADAENRITFQPDPGNTGDVVIQYGSQGSMNPWVFCFDRASYISLKNLTIKSHNTTYPGVICFKGHSHHDSILNCTINSNGNTPGTDAIWGEHVEMNDIAIIGNTVTDGAGGISLTGFNNPVRYLGKITISDNIFTGQSDTCISLERCDAPVITGNFISSANPAPGYCGIGLQTCPSGVTLTGNTVICNDAGTGISLIDCDRAFGLNSVIANNVVDVTAGTDSATCILTASSEYVDICFNTLRIGSFNTHENSNAYLNTGGSNINLWNNILCNFGKGRAYSNQTATAVESSNYNVLFTSGMHLAGWDNIYVCTLEELYSLSGMDEFSVFANPAFSPSGELRAGSSFLDGAGISVDGITADKDGVTRSDPPDIGAYEFSSSLIPMAGTYTIYGNTPDFTSIRQAMDSLEMKGVGGPVELIVRSGEYNETVGVVRKIGGTSTTNNIVLRSESGKPEDVKITSDQETYLLDFKGMDNFTIRDLTFSAADHDAGGTLAFKGILRNIKILNNRLISSNSTWNTLNFSFCITDSVLIQDNTVSAGKRGINFYGNSSRLSTNTLISGNSISGGLSQGMVIHYHKSPRIVANEVFNSSNSPVSYTGIIIRYCQEEILVTGNKIHNNNDSYVGLYVRDCISTEMFPGLVSNNMIRTNDGHSIRVTGCEYISFYHNSAHNTGTAGSCFWMTPSNLEINILNNVLFNKEASTVMSITDPAEVYLCDYNSYSSADPTKLINWDLIDYPDLPSFQAASGKDLNSIEVDPLFWSDKDLRISEPALHRAAMPLPEVSFDIDSIPRDPSNPDIGAAEFTCVTPDFNLYFAPHCQGDSTIIIDSSMNISPGSTRGWDFTGDLVPDVYSGKDFDTIIWLFEGTGHDSVTYIVDQIAGCVETVTIDVPFALQPELEITTKGAYCDADDGWASVTVVNVEGPFEYYWSDGQTTEKATDLALGVYTVAVTDPNGCTSTEDVEIGEAIQVSVTQLMRPTCGTPNGSAHASVTGGYPPYAYVWSNGELNDTGKLLLPGPHYVNVIDSKGCNARGSVNIEGDGGPEVNLVDVGTNACYGDTAGSIDIYVTGGVGPYSYLWSNGSTSQDIDNLTAGTYHLTVTDRDGCQGSKSIQVLQPSQISISPVVSPSTCLGSDGHAVAVVSGGTKPYLYYWSSGGTYQYEEGLAAGVYTVTVTDINGCQMLEQVVVEDEDGPVVSIDNVMGIGCSVTDNGSIDISVSPADTIYTYSWSSGDSTEDISGLTAGYYEVTVTDGNGCKGINRAEVSQDPPDINPICLVTVDTATGMNMLIWEKLVTEDVSHYNVYRESATRGDYHLVGRVGIGGESVFVDSVADPTIRSWRYRLSVVDDCGNESELSDPHKTMHLTMNLGLDNSVNLIWDHYEGFPITTYEIWRFDAISGWTNRANLPSNLTSYTDENPINEDLTYYIEVDHPTGCTSSDKKASTLNSSKSNRQNRKKSALNQPPVELSLDINIIAENKPAGTLVGRFSSSDPDVNDMHYYTLVPGQGDNDNIRFRISGDSLLSAEEFDYESNSTYSILVSTTDSGGLSLSKQFTIFIFNDSEPAVNQAPIGISLDISIVNEGKPAGSLVGRLATADPDLGDVHQYLLVPGLGSNNNGSFRISGDSLLTAEVFDYDSKNTYSILVSTTDTGGLSYVKQFTIFILDVVSEISPTVEQKLRVYPNPFNQSATISFPNPEGIKYRLVLSDISGKAYRIIDDITASEYILKKAGLKGGLYLIELQGPQIFRGMILIE